MKEDILSHDEHGRRLRACPQMQGRLRERFGRGARLRALQGPDAWRNGGSAEIREPRIQIVPRSCIMSVLSPGVAHARAEMKSD